MSQLGSVNLELARQFLDPEFQQPSINQKLPQAHKSSISAQVVRPEQHGVQLASAGWDAMEQARP